MTANWHGAPSQREMRFWSAPGGWEQAFDNTVQGRRSTMIGARSETERRERSQLLGRIAHVDVHIVEVVLRVFSDEGAIFVGDFAPQLSRNAGPEGARRDDGVLRNHGTGGDNTALADAAVVQDAGSHADYAHILDDAAVDRGVVPDGHPVADDDRIKVALAMENRAVLHVGAGAYADGIDIAAENGIHPHRGALAEHHIAKDLGREIDIATGRDLGRVAPVAADHGNLRGDLSSKCNRL
ncbi:hypothetical protein SBA5_300025 [Candidatus Sulfotelmatomonas gaucii]|uniref:Uncharacterized protein n=1 Tax=Candidatus Sulfuritelmatomonas gaucii TaxID=2043161 RepID=A0A2N9LDN2_9BACT|nr:hypothetical protein SBA5_300025 [Candidatus Sulfotelmatomonas gaucii]